MKLVYIAGPITAKTPWQRQQNIRDAEAAMIRLLKQGYAVICPHKNTASLDGAINRNHKVEHSFWINTDLEMLRRCDAVYALKTWESSRGARAEIQKAKELGLEILYE